MTLAQLLRAEQIILGLKIRDKAQLIEELSQRAARHVTVAAAAIASALAERERLGSTGLGKGFALPHVHMAGLAEPFGFLVRLARPIEFQAIDAKPVDVVFLLINPVDRISQHVTILATVARLMRDPNLLALIRKSGNPAALRDVLLATAEQPHN